MFDGDLDEIDPLTWQTLPLAFAVPPEDWTGPTDDVEPDDLGYSETDMGAADWNMPLQSLNAADAPEAWQDSTPEDERDPLGGGAPAESLAYPLAAQRLG